MTEPEIQIENRGRITSGRWEGQEIFIQDDRASSGGYLILIGIDDQGQQGGDVWVESQD